MKQSKKQLPALLAEFVKEAREEAVAAEREKSAAEIQKLVGGLLAITNRLAALGGVDCTVDVQRNAFAKEKPVAKKRKAVEASEDCVKAVMDIFEYAGPDKILLPKNIDAGFSNRIVSAACRKLALNHILQKVGTKGYRLVTPKENGLDETTLPSS